MQADEELNQTTKAASNDEWNMLHSKRKRVRSKRMNVQHWQTAEGTSSDEWDSKG